MKAMAWFLASVIPVSLLAPALLNRSDPSLIDFYGFIGFPIVLALTIAFIGRTIRAKDIPTSEKFTWIAILVLLFPFALALPVFAYERIVKPAKAAKIPTGNSHV
jgi:hypothetical protein